MAESNAKEEGTLEASKKIQEGEIIIGIVKDGGELFRKGQAGQRCTTVATATSLNITGSRESRTTS
jgi:hypothetical protein